MEPNMQKPDNNLVWAILITILCCWPFGIVAIVKAASVDGLWYSGRHDEALQAAADARRWSWIGCIVGIVFFTVYLTLVVFLTSFNLKSQF